LVVVRLRWSSSYRIVSTGLPRLKIFEEVAAPDDRQAVLELEAMTNPLLEEAARAIRLVPDRDRVIGPGADWVMAPFAYPRPSRFGDGTFGIYHGARDLATAIAETAYHRAAFLTDTAEPPGVFEHRVIEAEIHGKFADIAREADASSLLAPDDYAASQAFGRAVHDADGDGVVWPSVRRRGGRCAGVFRPRLVRNAHATRQLGYRWDGAKIVDIFEIRPLDRRFRTNHPRP
jgi:RES domain-containing protein